MQWVRATLAQLLGSASPDVRLRVRGIAVTDSVRFCGGGIDSFLGFEYAIVITLASHVFEYFLRFFLRACVICAFLASLGSHGVTPPPFLPTLTFSWRAVPLLGFLGFFGVRQSYSCVGINRQDDSNADSSASLAQCGFVGGFFPNFAIFALVSDHLRNFSFYSWASLLVLPSLLRLPILLSLSPLVTSLGGLGCSPPSLVIPVFCVWRILFL